MRQSDVVIDASVRTQEGTARGQTSTKMYSVERTIILVNRYSQGGRI